MWNELKFLGTGSQNGTCVKWIMSILSFKKIRNLLEKLATINIVSQALHHRRSEAGVHVSSILECK